MLGDPFLALPREGLKKRDEARSVANKTVECLASGDPNSAAAVVGEWADHADEEMIERLDRQLRREHPEAFDVRGRLRKRALTRLLTARFHGLQLSREQVDDVIATGREAAVRRRAAS